MQGDKIGMVSHVEILMIFLIAVGHPHEASESFIFGGYEPMVFPNQLPPASAAISNLVSGALGISDTSLFLSDLYWPCPLNNSSILNLTA